MPRGCSFLEGLSAVRFKFGVMWGGGGGGTLFWGSYHQDCRYIKLPLFAQTPMLGVGSRRVRDSLRV